MDEIPQSSTVTPRAWSWQHCVGPQSMKEIFHTLVNVQRHTYRIHASVCDEGPDRLSSRP